MHETGGTRKTARVVLPILGLSCGGGGALGLERALLRVPGVLRVYVNPATEMAYVEYDPARVAPGELAAAVARTGLRAGDAIPR